MPGFSVWRPIKNKTGTTYLKLEETGGNRVAVVIVDSRGHHKTSPCVITFQEDGTLLRHLSVNSTAGFQRTTQGKVQFADER